jgi:hypothetical protein
VSKTSTALVSGIQNHLTAFVTHQPEFTRAENDDGAGKGCAVFGVAEFQPPLDEPDFALHGVAVPPDGIGAGRDEADDRGTFLGGVEYALHPIGELRVGRVHENRLAAPVAQKPVLARREEPLALGIGPVTARVERETEFPVERIEEPLRRGPYVGHRLPQQNGGRVHAREPQAALAGREEPPTRRAAGRDDIIESLVIGGGACASFASGPDGLCRNCAVDCRECGMASAASD